LGAVAWIIVGPASRTSLGPTGDDFVANFTADYYQKLIQSQENALNHFLKTGCRLADENASDGRCLGTDG
jgi:hypothetical protein